MTRHSLRSNQDGFSKVAEDCMFRVNQLEQQFIAGDILWIKLKNCSWWPAQVIDENFVCEKPKKKLKDDILIRLYGSYEYQYVNPHKCSMEFENVLRQQKMSTKEIFQNALEMDLSQITSDGKSRRKVSATRGKTSAKALISKRHFKESTSGLPSVVLSSSQGSSSVSKKLGKKQKEMDDASNTPAANKEIEPDEAKESSEANSVIADSTKEYDTNRGTYKMHKESEGTKRSSGVENQHTLQRSQRRKVEEQVAKQSENGKVEVEMKHGGKEQLKEKVTGGTFKRHLKSRIPYTVERAVNGDSALKKRKQNGLTEAEIKDAELARQVVINELLEHGLIKLGEPKMHGATVETSKRTKLNGLQRREVKNLLEHQNEQTSTCEYTSTITFTVILHYSMLCINNLITRVKSHHMQDEYGDYNARKTRVMQSLGLVAPSGSPSHRYGEAQ